MKVFKVNPWLILSLLSASCSPKQPAPQATLPSVPPVESQVTTEQSLNELPASVVATTPASGAAVPAESQSPAAVTSRQTDIQTPAHVSAPSTASAAPKAPQAEAPACLTFSFQHHAGPKHTLGPDCSHHKNRVQLPEGILKGEHDLNQLCVRVDGVPVMAVREKDSLILGSVPRSRSIISIRACRKGATCSESCKIPRDELMNELAGETDSSDGGWDGESAGKVHGVIDDDIKRELAALEEEEISKDWALSADGGGQTAACSVKKTLAQRKGR